MTVVVVLLGLFLSAINGYYYFCGFQARGYKIKESLSGVTKLMIIDSIAIVCTVIISLAFELSGYEKSDFLCLISLIPSFAAGLTKIIKYIGLRAIFTKRMIRLFSVYAVICVVLTLVACFVERFLRVFGIVVGLNGLLSFGVLSLTKPFEDKRNRKFLQNAKNKLASKSVTVIGITGSAGKTSVKEILKTLLSPLGKVYATPKSYNTPLGIAKAVQEMPEDAEVFIVEYGARNKGDIDELLGIVKPNIGILTAIAPQHLETFGNIESIFNEKIKLLKAAERSFAAEKCKWAGDDFPVDTIFYGESCYTNKIFATENSFLSIIVNGQKLAFTTALLGSVNADNLVLSIGVALSLGVTPSQIAEILPTIKPVPHRMERLVSDKGVTIIDDSFNINPSGASSALDVLKTAKGRKIVTCSGFVEQGDNDDEANETLTSKIVEVADIFIILGNKNKKKLIEKVKDKIEYYFVKDVDECIKLYSQILKKDDTLLILADIPISYEL